MNRRRDASPVSTAEFVVKYDRSERVDELVRRLTTPRQGSDAVLRLRAHAESAEATLRAELARERNEHRRWWLRGALQAIEDLRGLGAAP